MKYLDNVGKEIKKGDIIVIGDGKPEVVYAVQDRATGEEGLGVNASNLGWLERAQAKGLKVEQEFYSLTQFPRADIAHVPDCFKTDGEEPYPECVGDPLKPCPECPYYKGRE